MKVIYCVVFHSIQKCLHIPQKPVGSGGSLPPQVVAVFVQGSSDDCNLSWQSADVLVVQLVQALVLPKDALLVP